MRDVDAEEEEVFRDETKRMGTSAVPLLRSRSRRRPWPGLGPACVPWYAGERVADEGEVIDVLRSRS